mgnify:CR=1 FL=1
MATGFLRMVHCWSIMAALRLRRSSPEAEPGSAEAERAWCDTVGEPETGTAEDERW